MTAPSRPDRDRARWRILALLSCAELLGMSVWFSASAVSERLELLWDLDRAQTGWLTSAVQLGFVAGTAAAAVLNLADIVPARAYFAGSALLAAAANAGLVVAPGFGSALLLRFLTGLFLAGVYPPAMKMVATWFSSSRGLAVGALVGALTVGKAAPYLLAAFASGAGAGFGAVVLIASCGAVLAAVLVALGYSDGPFHFERRPFSWSLAVQVVRDRRTRLAVAGYLGHMWELYAMWAWISAFAAASLAARDVRAGAADTAQWGAMIGFAAIASGGLGCVWGGWMADRVGRERLVTAAMAASGVCCLVMPVVYGAGPVILVALACVWGFFVVADSAQFSTLVTEVSPRHAVGTALTLQTSLGFLLTMVTIQLVPILVGWYGWRWAFPVLALGPAAGIAAIRRLVRTPRLPQASGRW